MTQAGEILPDCYYYIASGQVCLPLPTQNSSNTATVPVTNYGSLIYLFTYDNGGTGLTLSEARKHAYRALESVRFDGMQFRTDIALKAESGTQQ